jgi:2-polyprenyl-3-methyl-5-hydroxy-6-metoxy-1,4-benzoquinol methylase
MTDNLYKDKDKTYFGKVRKEILPLLPDSYNKILDVGCGSGATLAYLKTNGYCKWTCGVELFPEAVEVAQRNLDCVYEGNIELIKLPLEESSFDVILCLDVLEHLVNPELVVSYLHTLLAPGGIMIASIPNVRHYSVVFPLVFMGQWNYQDSGILDKTHLKFFVKKTAIALMESSGLVMEKVISLSGYKDRLAIILSLFLLKPFFVLQYLVKVKKMD